MDDAGETFDELVNDIDYPMLIVTGAAGEEHAGCLVGFATQTSLDPPRFLVCLSRANRTTEVAASAETLVVHFVPPDADDLVALFGSRSGHDTDKLGRCAWRAGPGGAPVLEDCPDWFAGRVLERLDLGDHVGHLLEPTEAQRGSGEGQFSFQRARRFPPGREA